MVRHEWSKTVHLSGRTLAQLRTGRVHETQLVSRTCPGCSSWRQAYRAEQGLRRRLVALFCILVMLAFLYGFYLGVTYG